MILGSIGSVGRGSLVMVDVAAPFCRLHGLRIILCLECCQTIFREVGGLGIDARHEWAVANIYVEGAERSPASV